MSTANDQIEKMYAAQLASQKEQLQQDYSTADAELIASLQKSQQTTNKNLTRTAVESQKAAVNNAELHNATGLSSGARAQVRLAQENQLQADLTALRQQQLQTETDIQRQRDVLSREYASAIRKAQADNDMARAEALYAQAQKDEERLLARQQSAAQLMANAGDYSRLANLYGLSANEVEALRSSASAGTGGTSQSALAAAKLMAEETGDYTRLAALYGLSKEELAALHGQPTSTPNDTTPANNPVANKATYPVYQAKKAVAVATGKTYTTPTAQAFINRFAGYEDMGYSDSQMKALIENALLNSSDTFGLTDEDFWIINDRFGLGFEERMK